MVNRWKPTQEQREKFIPILDEYIIKVKELEKSNKEPCPIDFYGQGISPYQLQCILIDDLGFEEEAMDTNGWEMAYSFYLCKEGIRYVIAGTGITHEIRFYVDEVSNSSAGV